MKKWLLLLFSIWLTTLPSYSFNTMSGSHGFTDTYSVTRPFSTAAPTLTYTTNLKMWIKADAETYANNDLVATLTDQSGNGNNLTQAVDGLKCTYKTNILNGYAAYYCPDNDRLYGSAYNIDDTKSGTLFIVFKTDANEVNVLFETIDGVLLVGSLNSTTIRTWSNTGGNSADVTVSDSTAAYYYYTIILNENTGANGVANIRQSGVDKGSSASRARGASTTVNLPHTNGAAQSTQGYIVEALYYEEAVAGANLTTVESYLASKYAL